MSGFGEAAGAIGVTIGVFNLCVDGLCAVSRAKHAHESLMDFKTRLDLEIARLVLWGRNTGLDHNELDASLEPVQPLLTQILTAISNSVKTADQLRASYGLELVEDRDAGSSPDVQTPTSSGTHRKLDILSLPQISSEIQRQRLLSFQFKKKTKLYQKIKWAVWDGEKANSFVEAIKGYVDGLNKLLTESQKAALDAEMAALRIALLGTNWSNPTKFLRSIESATLGRYDSMALPARLARVRLELEMEETAPSLSNLDQPFAPPLQIPNDKLRHLNAEWSMGDFHGGNVLVEWRDLTATEAAGEKGKARKRQAAKLVSVLQQLKTQPAKYRILDCSGYINQLDHRPPRLGTVFNMSASTIPSAHAKEPFHSLHDYISSRKFEDFQPPLGARFELARSLAEGFLQFHQSGWYHKNIRSHNIIFFSQGGKPFIERPFILGFAHSRPSEKGVSDPTGGENEIALYRHPHYRTKPGTSFKLEYDLFSIGLLLFEVAKWRPLQNYFTRFQRMDPTVTSATFAATLVAQEKNELEFRVGIHYATAVLTCLETAFEVEGDDPNNTGLKLAYFEKVIKNLAACKA